MSRTIELGVAAIAVLLAVAITPRAAQAQAPSVFSNEVERHEQRMEQDRPRTPRPVNGVYPRYMDGGEKPNIPPEAPPIAYLDNFEPPGTIIIATKERQLYYVLPGKRAYAYPISVGRDGFTWTGTERISRIVAWPSWTPPPEMRARQPGLPITVSGGVINPLGAKALYLGSSIYRIHGTNNARSIGRASSSGCFRMMNQHVNHLATLARVGTTVRVVASYSGVSESMPLSQLFSGVGGTNDEPPPPQRRAKRKPRQP